MSNPFSPHFRADKNQKLSPHLASLATTNKKSPLPPVKEVAESTKVTEIKSHSFPLPLMSSFTKPTPISCPLVPGWRRQAARIVEEIFTATDPLDWDHLLDLRSGLLQCSRWENVVDLFLQCRHRMEKDAYLPFYRLRNLLAVSLKLNGRGEFQKIPMPSLELLFRQNHKSFAEWKRQLEREWFELGCDATRLRMAELEVVESAPPTPVGVSK